jgi:uncharacterized protein
MYFNLYRDALGQWRWQLVAANHSDIIADSAEGYINRADAVHGIQLVRGTSAANRIFDRNTNSWTAE